MVLAASGLADHLHISPWQFSEVIGKSNAGEAGGCRRAAAFADGNIILNLQSERHNVAPGCPQNFGVGSENEMIFEILADFMVAAAGDDRESFGGLRVDGDVEIERDR